MGDQRNIDGDDAESDLSGAAPVFDRRWHQLALAGDDQAIALFAQQLLEPLYRFCFHRLGRNQTLAEDVVQQTMLVAIERLESYDPQRSEGRIWGWASGLARNEIRRTVKHYENGVSLQQFWETADAQLIEALGRIESETLNEADLLRNETRQLVNVTMSQLPTHYQRALEAKYLNGLTLHQMAELRGVSIEAVESTLLRARRAFREAFEVFRRAGNPGADEGDALPGSYAS